MWGIEIGGLGPGLLEELIPTIERIVRVNSQTHSHRVAGQMFMD